MPAFNGSNRQGFADTNRAFYRVLAGVILLHTLLVFSPWFNVDMRLTTTHELIHVHLTTPPRKVETSELPSLASVIPDAAPAEAVSQPAPAAVIEPPDPDPVQPTSRVPHSEMVKDIPALRTRILASPYLEEEPLAANLFSIRAESNGTESVFHFRDRPNMDSVLNPTPDQLPFANGPRFELASYTPGVVGDVQRFFDFVTLEKEWVTKHGTRVKCAWVLIFAGCGWD